jgi:hypothetical protein
MSPTGKMTVPNLRAAPPSAAGAPHLLRLPLEVRVLILRYIWPAAVHIEAHTKRPTNFRHHECRQEAHFGHNVRHPPASSVMRQETHFVRDERHPASGSLMRPGYYDEVHEEDEAKQTWFSTHGSAWRNHFLCEWEVKKVDIDAQGADSAIFQERSDEQPPSGFLPVLLVCKRL